MKSKIFSIFFALIFYIALPISVSKVVLASEETREQVKLMFRINTDTIIFCNVNTGENCNSSIYRSGKRTSYKELLSKNPNIEICYRPNYQKIFAVKTFQKTRSSSHSSAKITNKNCNQVFIDAKILIHVKDTLFVTYSQIEIDKIKKKKKAAEEKRIADEKVAEEKRIADEKVAEEKRIADEKVAEEKLKKKLSLIPAQTDLEKAQIFLVNVQKFIKRSPNVFDIVKISEFFTSTKPILEGTIDVNLKNEIKLFKEFTSSYSSFVFYINEIEKKRIDEELTKIDETLLVLERNIKTLEQLILSDPNSIYQQESVLKITKAKKIFNDLSNFEQLLIANDDLKKLISIKQEIIKQRNYSSILIEKLKEYLRLNLTTDLAPLIIEKIKLLEISAKKESAEDLISANQIAKKFIYTTFEEPEEKRIAEEERIAEEKRAKEIRKNRILGMECSDLQKQSTGQKLSNAFGKVVEILYIDDPEQSFRDDNNLECRANAKLSDARNIEIKMKIYRENGQIFTSIEVLN